MSKFVFRVLTIGLLLLAPLVSLAQDRQIEVRIGSSATSSNLNTNTPFSIGSGVVLPISEDVTVVGNADIARFKLNTSPQVGYFGRAGGELRYYVEQAEFKSFKPFASGGIDVSRLGYGAVHQNFVSPTLGAGLNYENLIVAQYFYVFPDLTSPLDVRGHHIKGDAYIPLSANWKFRLGLEHQRSRTQASGSGFNTTTGIIGVSRLF